MMDFSPARGNHTSGPGSGPGSVEGSAYTTWLQSALHKQTALLNEKNEEINQLHERLTEAERLLSSGHAGRAGADPEGFLIERIVDEEEKNARLEAQRRDDVQALQHKDALIASMTDEIRSLNETLRHNRRARHEDVVKTHMEWAAAHLIHNPSALPLEAVGVMLEDIKHRRKDLLHLTQRIEDWYGCLMGHYYTTVQMQKRKPRRDGVASYTAEIRVNADALFNRLRGECVRITHAQIEELVTQNGLYNSRADAAAFVSAFRTVKSIVQSAGPPPGFTYNSQSYAAIPPHSTGSGTTAAVGQGSIPANLPSFWVKDGADIRLDAVARTQLKEAVRELVLCYDSSPRSIQSGHPKLINELHLNCAPLVAALRAGTPSSAAPANQSAASAMEIAAAGIMAPPVFPVSLLDARFVTRDEDGAAVANARNAHNIAHIIPPYAVFPEHDPPPPAPTPPLPSPATTDDGLFTPATAGGPPPSNPRGGVARGRADVSPRPHRGAHASPKTSVSSVPPASAGGTDEKRSRGTPFSRTHSLPTAGRAASPRVGVDPAPQQPATVIRRLNLGLTKLSAGEADARGRDSGHSPLKSRLQTHATRRIASPRITARATAAGAASAAAAPRAAAAGQRTHVRNKSPDPRASVRAGRPGLTSVRPVAAKPPPPVAQVVPPAVVPPAADSPAPSPPRPPPQAYTSPAPLEGAAEEKEATVKDSPAPLSCDVDAPPPPPEETPPDTPVEGEAVPPPPPPPVAQEPCEDAAAEEDPPASVGAPAPNGLEGSPATPLPDAPHVATTPAPITPPSVDGVTPQPMKQLPDGLEAPETGGRCGRTPKTPPSMSHSQSDTPPLPTRNDSAVQNALGLSPMALAAQMSTTSSMGSIGSGPPRSARGMSSLDDSYAFGSGARYSTFDDDFDAGADGFLSEAQRREVKERAMGNFKVPSDDALMEEVSTTSREDMMRQLKSWSGHMNNKLAQRGQRHEEAWSDDEEEEEEEDSGPCFGSPHQEFDEPLDINHPDYLDPETVAGPSILRPAPADREPQDRDDGARRRVTFNEEQLKEEQPPSTDSF